LARLVKITVRDYFIRDHFLPDDRLVVACKDRNGRFLQRFVSAKELLKPRIAEWLKKQNDNGANIYICMNAFNPDARQRTKKDVAAIRHIYLDVDYNGDEVLRRIAADDKTPEPSYVIKTSPGKYQIIWKAEGFGADEAEALNRGMAMQYGADSAAIDVSRMLRLSGFLNHKYDPPYMVTMVTAEKFSNRVYKPSDFGVKRHYEQSVNCTNHGQPGVDTPSHRDWHEVRKRLEAGENPAVIQADLAASARARGKSEKYAEITIRKAQAKNAVEARNRELWIAARKAERLCVRGIATGIPISEQTFNREEIMKKTELIPKLYLHADDEVTREAILRSAEKIRNITEQNANGKNVKAFILDKNDGKLYTYSQTALEKAHVIIAETMKDPAFQAETAPKEEKTKYIIGTAPAGMAEEIRTMSMEAKKQGNAGMLWNDDQGWNTTNKELADAVHKAILEKQPRFYIEGSTYEVKDQLAAIKDDNEKHIAFFDKYQGAWYALSEENRNRITADIDIPPKREKLYLETADRAEREAVFQCREKFKEIREPNAEGKEVKTFSFDEFKGQWYTRSHAALAKARMIVAEKMNEPAFQSEMTKREQIKENQRETHQNVPLRIDGIPSEELRKQMKEKGCRFNGEQNIWTAPDGKTAKEVQAIIDAVPKRAIAATTTETSFQEKQAARNYDSGGMGD
jgi:hypothetical protein